MRFLYLILILCFGPNSWADDQPHNIILFVPDGLRALMVNPHTAPAMAAVRDEGVNFINSHALFPTFTTPNASAMATGHYLADTGDFSNTIYTGFPVPGAGDSLTPFLESDPVLGDVDEHFSGDYLDEETILKAAHKAGLNTAAVGKLGPVLIFDHTDRDGQETVIVDDSTGSSKGIPITPWMADGMTALHLTPVAPTRGDNSKPGNAKTPGTLQANVDQQQWFVNVFDKIILPKFKQNNKGFVAVFWSRDPDGTQHNQGDSLLKLTPGINGPTSLAAIKNADYDLRQIEDTLKALGLADTTDIMVASDHGFSTIYKESSTSLAAKDHYDDVPDGLLPPGFLAKDLALKLDLPLWDPDQKNIVLLTNQHPKFANGLIGNDPQKPLIVVAGNGGSDLVYLPQPGSSDLAARVVKILLAQDYVSGIFVDSDLGRYPGTLTLEDIDLKGSAVTPMPAIVVNFKSFTTGCDVPANCTVEIADTALQQGQGMHGNFSRADTYNFMAASGPDFKAHFIDKAPTSNADIGKTMAAIMQLDIPDKGKLYGRVLTEALPQGAMPKVTRGIIKSDPFGTARLHTVVKYQQVGETRYFDVAGFAHRTVGLNNDQTN